MYSTCVSRRVYRRALSSLVGLAVVLGLLVMSGSFHALGVWAAAPMPNASASWMSPDTVSGPVFNPANGHYYEFVAAHITWSDAWEAAEARSYQGCGGYLATATSADEEKFILGNVVGVLGSAWMGGFQEVLVEPPDAGWQWVTGEPFLYVDWKPGEPNDYQGPHSEQVLQLCASGWNDFESGKLNETDGFMVEYECAGAATTTTLTSSPNPSKPNVAITFTATVNSASGVPTGNVLFYEGTTDLGTAPLAGVQATLTVPPLPVGQHLIKARYLGNANFRWSASPGLRHIVAMSNTYTALTAAPNPSVQGQAVTFAATVASSLGMPIGNVSFTSDGVLLATVPLVAGTASYTTNVLPTGIHQIQAAYGGQAQFDPSTSPRLTQTVVAIPGSECHHWDLAADFRIAPNHENPSRDSCGNPNVWYYMTGPENRDTTAYSLFPYFGPDFNQPILQAWRVSNTQVDPHVTYNPLNTPATVTGQVIPPLSVFVHPGSSELVMVGWRSPITGRIAISGSMADLNPAYGDGVLWYIDKGATNLASGAIPNGGTQAFHNGSGGNNLADVPVQVGEFVYFIVHKNQEYSCDSTQLVVSISTATTQQSYLYLPLVSRPGAWEITDDFSNPNSGWPTWDTSTSAAGYVNGEYRVLVKAQDSVAHAGRGGPVGDFFMQADARAAGGLDGSNGLYFAYNTGSYYFFEISNGSYALYRRDGSSGTWSAVIDWSPSSWLRGGQQTNTLKVAKNGSQLGLYANGHLLVQRSDIPVGSGMVGLAAASVSPNYETRFDNFALYSNDAGGSGQSGGVVSGDDHR